MWSCIEPNSALPRSTTEEYARNSPELEGYAEQGQISHEDRINRTLTQFIMKETARKQAMQLSGKDYGHGTAARGQTEL